MVVETVPSASPQPQLSNRSYPSRSQQCNIHASVQASAGNDGATDPWIAA